MISDSTFHKIKKALGYFIPFLLTFVFLYLAFHDVDLAQAVKLIGNSSVVWLLPFLFVFMLSHFIRAIRWKFILRSVKKDTSILNLFGTTMVGYGVNCVVPRLGELYRALFIGKWEGLSRSSMLGTIIVERVIDILALGISVLISVLIYSGNLYEEIEWLRSAVIFGFAAIFLVILFLVLLVKLKENFYNGILKIAGKFSKKIAEKLSYVFMMLIDGFQSLKGITNYLVVIILTVLIMLVYGYNSLLGFYMLGMDEIVHVNYGTAWVVMTISAFGIVIPTPGGTGSYHFIVKSVLVGLYGFSEEFGSAYALLTHLISYLTFIASTVLFVYIINRRRVKQGFPKENFLSVFKYREK